MKIAYGEDHNNTELVKNIFDIPVDTVFSGEITTIGGIYLRTLNSVVNLQSPQSVWPICSLRDDCVNVFNYQRLEAEILVRGEIR